MRYLIYVSIHAALAWLVATLLLSSCSLPAGPDEDGSEIVRACVRSFAPTLREWERLSGERVPAECSLLDLEYDVQVVDDDAGIPCAGDPRSNGLQVGCTRVDERVIYILGGRDDLAMVDTPIHEWIHALADCVLGDPDREHLRAGLWARYGAGSVEVQAMASAEIGRCL